MKTMNQKRGEISTTIRKELAEILVNESLRELVLKVHDSRDISVLSKQESFSAQVRIFIEVIDLHPHYSDQKQEEMITWSEVTGTHLFKALGSDHSRDPSH